LKPKLSPAP